MARLAVIRQKGLSKACSSWLKSSVRTGLPSFKAAWHLVSNCTSLVASLSLPDLAALV